MEMAGGMAGVDGMIPRGGWRQMLVVREAREMMPHGGQRQQVVLKARGPREMLLGGAHLHHQEKAREMMPHGGVHHQHQHRLRHN